LRVTTLSVPAQLAHAVWHGPLAIRRLRARGLAWLVVYVALAALILGFVAHQVRVHEGDVVELLVGYVFPADWGFAGRALVKRLIAAQERALLVNAAIATSLVIIQVLLFPVKEFLSSAFEREARLVDLPIDEFPLWFQAWEELKLFLYYLAAQGCIFWLGYTTDPARKQLALGLSYLYLFASFGIDFISPVLQRHKQRYSTMLKTLALHPVLVVGFGAVFSLPTILVGRWVAAHGTMSFGRQLGWLFAANIAGIAWAAIAGTHVGAKLVADARQTRRPAPATRALAWLALLSVLGWNAWRFGAVGLALHHKSQILKCHYALDWTSIGVDRPSVFGLASGLRHDAIDVGVHFDVTIDNPTTYDVVIEKNHLDVTNQGKRVATASLSPLAVPAGGSARAHVSLPLRVAPSAIAQGRALLDGDAWAVTWWLEVAGGFDFPVYLKEAKRP
jgi:uncharacterized protein involved in cysteine biosynthesis